MAAPVNRVLAVLTRECHMDLGSELLDAYKTILETHSYKVIQADPWKLAEEGKMPYEIIDIMDKKAGGHHEKR